MILTLGVLLGVFKFAAAQSPTSRLDKVSISFPAPTISAMVLEAARHKGFYKDEGLDVTLARVPRTPGVQGMLAGDFDFATNVGGALTAGLRGTPFKLIMLNESTIFWLYAKSGITSINTVKGKKVGMSTRGSLTDINLTALLEKNGIDPMKDVLKIVIAGPGTRLAALHSGSVARPFSLHHQRSAPDNGPRQIARFKAFSIFWK